MPKGIDIIVRNKLAEEKRDLNAYHHAKRSAYFISHCNIVTIPLGTKEDGDYLHISIVSGPGKLEKGCLVDLPSWCDFSFSSIGNGNLSHSGDRILLKIPPGPPSWQLTVTRPPGNMGTPDEDVITIGNDKPKPEGCK